MTCTIDTGGIRKRRKSQESESHESQRKERRKEEKDDPSFHLYLCLLFIPYIHTVACIRLALLVDTGDASPNWDRCPSLPFSYVLQQYGPKRKDREEVLHFPTGSFPRENNQEEPAWARKKISQYFFRLHRLGCLLPACCQAVLSLCLTLFGPRGWGEVRKPYLATCHAHASFLPSLDISGHAFLAGESLLATPHLPINQAVHSGSSSSSAL